MAERDQVLRRVERDAVVYCFVAAGLALLVLDGKPDVSAGILAGGGLIAVSYWAIKSSIDGLAGTARVVPGQAASGPNPDGRLLPGRRRASIAWPLVKFGGRYALLGFLAYVMILRLRLHPVGLLAGASSLVAAAAIEAVRFVASSGTSRAPRAR